MLATRNLVKIKHKLPTHMFIVCMLLSDWIDLGLAQLNCVSCLLAWMQALEPGSAIYQLLYHVDWSEAVNLNQLCAAK